MNAPVCVYFYTCNSTGLEKSVQNALKELELCENLLENDSVFVPTGKEKTAILTM